jgi:hypothetical protein
MQAEQAKGELKRSLSALNLISLGIGCIIGTGIFVLTGRAAANFAGPAIMISFIITGVLCTFVALVADLQPRCRFRFCLLLFLRIHGRDRRVDHGPSADS